MSPTEDASDSLNMINILNEESFEGGRLVRVLGETAMSATTEAKAEHKCPECGSGEVRRSQMRGFLERGVLKALGARAYRCEGCDRRYYEFKRIDAKDKTPGRIKDREDRDER